MMRSALVLASVAAVSAAANKPLTGAADAIHNVIDGAGNVIQGAADHLENKADKFVDSAGNVYSVIKDAAGSATGLVMDAAGAVWDVTKLGGSFVIDQILSYPGEVLDSAKDSVAELRGMAGGLPQFAGQLANAAYMPSLPPLKEMMHPSSWIQAGQENWHKGGDSLNELYAAFAAPYNSFEDKYCTPATLVPSTKKQTKITMPGFVMEIAMGECVVMNDEALADCLFDKETCDRDAIQLDCLKPELAYAHVPGEVVYKHHTAVEFRTKECKVEKVHGEEEELVLYEFKDHNVDLQALADQVSTTVGSAVGSLASGASNIAQDLVGFVGKKEDKADFDAFVAKYSGQ